MRLPQNLLFVSVALDAAQVSGDGIAHLLRRELDVLRDDLLVLLEVRAELVDMSAEQLRGDTPDQLGFDSSHARMAPGVVYIVIYQLHR